MSTPNETPDWMQATAKEIFCEANSWPRPWSARAIDTLLAILAKHAPDAAKLEAQWQPIETAPRDRTMILGINPQSSLGCVTVFYNSALSKWCSSWEASAIIAHQPTHWMPLPAPPSTPARI